MTLHIAPHIHSEAGRRGESIFPRCCIMYCLRALYADSRRGKDLSFLPAAYSQKRSQINLGARAHQYDMFRAQRAMSHLRVHVGNPVPGVIVLSEIGRTQGQNWCKLTTFVVSQHQCRKGLRILFKQTIKVDYCRCYCPSTKQKAVYAHMFGDRR